MPTSTDWEGKYLAGDTPWEKGAGSPGLEDFLDKHPTLTRGSVLVPGCGTGHDVRTFARHGFHATGMDLAPSAIRLAREYTEAAGLHADFQLGNFVSDPPERSVDWIFEHTLYCAIDPADRDRYAEAVTRRLTPGGHFLAVHYMIDDPDGPPFGCTQPELMDRFSNAFELLESWVPRSYPNRLGLELMLWWRRR